MEFINVLCKNKLICWFINDYDNKRIKELTYLNEHISECYKLNYVIFIKALDEIAKENIIDEYYKLFNNWLCL